MPFLGTRIYCTGFDLKVMPLVTFFKDFPVLFTKSSCCFCPFLKGPAFFQRLPCPFHKVQLLLLALFSKGLPPCKDFPVLFTKFSSCFCPFPKRPAMFLFSKVFTSCCLCCCCSCQTHCWPCSQAAEVPSLHLWQT